MQDLSKMDEVILLSVFKLKDNAYGVTIRRKIEEMMERIIGYGTLYSALDQLVKRGLVLKITGEPTHERGGRRKNYYKITQIGAEALKTARDQKNVLWEGVTASSLDRIND
ncbi:MAG: PadR family transcriptional regulator [bacterium]|nr:PadR family transcriptional regulator [bacterium]